MEGFTICVNNDPGSPDINDVRIAAIHGIQQVFNEPACRKIGVSTTSTFVVNAGAGGEVEG